MPGAKSTYQTDFQRPAPSQEPRRSSHGRLGRDGIMPVIRIVQRGIEGTRFLSENDVRLAAIALSFNIDPFPEKPYTPKEKRMVRGMAFRMGLVEQTGGFVGELRCLVKKGGLFAQYPTNLSDVRVIINNHKFDYASLWGDIGTIVATKLLRIDLQPPPPSYQNIQIQANVPRQKKQSTSIATILLHHNLGIFNTAEQVAQQKHVLRKVRHALLLSEKTGASYELELGAPSVTLKPMQ